MSIFISAIIALVWSVFNSITVGEFFVLCLLSWYIWKSRR
jgi:hypothetical protein